MDNNSDDSTVYGQHSALPIPTNVTLGDLTLEPESGEQYMLRVRMEAISMPSIAVVNNREQMLLATAGAENNYDRNIKILNSRSQPDDEPVSDIVKPCKAWMDSYATWFSCKRNAFVRMVDQVSVPDSFVLPESGQAREWKSFCYETSGRSQTNRAMLYTLAAIDQTMAMRLIKWMTTWLAVDKLQRAEGIWLWHLILKLDSLLDHDDTHALRELCRQLKKIRTNIGYQSRINMPNLVLYRGEEIAAINILIASITRGYSQRDLD
ncbi:hypothetical protein GGI25_005729 [Coemansia spiralis]|uniref:Uncharacterized protein n=2 Tax=Coemansia TaxID=4863 RepID=A0A9W8FY64_9FUNG|nr:survival motor neuron interacting protein 1-domain-containing protein [Coemansia spiralis]KAJ1988678.1 hypothetical protein EDC05_005153 [Coemansia umbellata]KAJ2619862.1 hypothetical protein GGI26_005481 [Coemansia sp. RSA 1358]KAJ2670810.1 hypothetical protein GGI25_005729 [Coemansia spiralis]